CSSDLHPLAIASALAVLEVMEEEQLVTRAAKLGGRLVEVLKETQGSVPEIADIRGLGAMVAIELTDRDSKAPNAAFARKVQQIAMEQGLILLVCGTYANVIRFLFPLTIEEDTLEEGLKILADSLKKASASA